MESEMTMISKEFFNSARSNLFTIQDAVQYLEKEAKMRTLREKLEKFSHGQDLRKTLVQGLLENDPNRKKDAVERRVRGWLGNNSSIHSIKKQDAIEVCFILELSMEEADQFVAMVSEEALHYRNPDEIVYIFALQHGLSYKEAAELNEQMMKKISIVKDGKEPAEDSFTPVIRREIDALQSKEELADYLEHAAGRLGRYHNHAYQEFMDRLRLLENPPSENLLTKEDHKEKHFTMRDILREYLFEKNILYAKEKERLGKKKDRDLSAEERLVFTKVQESVSASWPDETTLSKMKSRKTDVTRKVLILLFLATDQGRDWSELPEYYWTEENKEKDDAEPQNITDHGMDDETIPEYWYEDMDDAMTRDEAFEDLYIRLNDMLLLCGFAPLDPRSPFDWLILYCICVEDMFDVDIRMRGVFKEMFGERTEEENNE